MLALFGCDHAGYDLKRVLLELAQERGWDVEDLGVHDRNSADYPDYAHAVAARVSANPELRGVLVCGTGIGMAMAANRHPAVRAAVCHDAFTAEMARRHNDANVLCLGGRVTGAGVALQILDLFLATPFDGGRHAPRVAKIEKGSAA